MEEVLNVSDSNITLQLGKNIRFFRKVKGYTLKDLADKLSDMTGQSVSGTAIGFWERGEKNLTAVQLHYLSVILGVKEQSLYDLGGFNAVEDIGSFNDMLHYAAAWNGNRKALVQLVRLYMCLAKKDRADIAGMGIHMYQNAKSLGRLEKNAPEIDITYLEDEWLKLMR